MCLNLAAFNAILILCYITFNTPMIDEFKAVSQGFSDACQWPNQQKKLLSSSVVSVTHSARHLTIPSHHTS